MEYPDTLDTFLDAYALVPKGTSLPHTDEECYEVYFNTIEIIARRAPVTAKRIADLWMEPNPYISGNPPIRDISWGAEYLRLKAIEAGANPNGRPADASIENAEAQMARQRARERKHAAKAESKAAYEERLAKYARRRAAIADAKANVLKCVADKDKAIADAKANLQTFIDQCEDYVRQQRLAVKELEAIHADDWPY